MLICRYWTVALDSLSISGNPVAVAATSVVIDSGTSAILLGPDDSQAIHGVHPCTLTPPPGVAGLSNADTLLQARLPSLIHNVSHSCSRAYRSLTFRCLAITSVARPCVV